MSRDADRAFIAAEQAGARCEVPPHTYVPLVRHHPEVLRRQLVAHRAAVGDPWYAPLAVAGTLAAMTLIGIWLAEGGL